MKEGSKNRMAAKAEAGGERLFAFSHVVTLVTSRSQILPVSTVLYSTRAYSY